jgi:hypothetical protein
VIICVLGMHKSGTTLVAETLHRSGIDMGVFDDELGYDDGNTYERHEAVDFNREMLAKASIPTWHGARFDRRERNLAGYRLNSDSLSLIRRDKLASVLARTDLAPLRLLVDELSAHHPDWGFKDPRTCLTYDVWRRALPRHRVVAVYRLFDEVLAHYGADWKAPVQMARVVRSWIVHNEMLLEHLRRRNDYVLLRYDELMRGNDELARMAAYLGRSLEDCRRAGMYRARISRAGELSKALFIVPPRVMSRVARIERDLDGLRGPNGSFPLA